MCHRAAFGRYVAAAPWHTRAPGGWARAGALRAGGLALRERPPVRLVDGALVDVVKELGHARERDGAPAPRPKPGAGELGGDLVELEAARAHVRHDGEDPLLVLVAHQPLAVRAPPEPPRDLAVGRPLGAPLGALRARAH